MEELLWRSLFSQKAVANHPWSFLEVHSVIDESRTELCGKKSTLHITNRTFSKHWSMLMGMFKQNSACSSFSRSGQHPAEKDELEYCKILEHKPKSLKGRLTGICHSGTGGTWVIYNLQNNRLHSGVSDSELGWMWARSQFTVSVTTENTERVLSDWNQFHFMIISS